MNSVIMITQFFFTLVIGMYFFTKTEEMKKATVKPLQTIQKKRLNTLIVCVIYIYLNL